MKLLLLVNGKLEEKAYQVAIEKYTLRLGHFLPFEIEVIPDASQASIRKESSKRKAYEAEQIKRRLDVGDRILLLDEKGKQVDSLTLASYCQKVMASGVKRWVWIIGGPYGFDQSIYSIAHEKLSLSSLTLPHDMARLVATEQLYRAFSILNHLPYHHV